MSDHIIFRRMPHRDPVLRTTALPRSKTDRTGSAIYRLRHLFCIAVVANALCIFGAHAADGGGAAAATETPAAGDAVRGVRLYRQFCLHCHGPNLVNPGTNSFDLRLLEPTEKPRFTNSVMNGKGNMPPWAAVLKPVDLESLWAYIMENRSGK